MNDRLKNFIAQNRGSLDDLAPPDLWPGIQQTIRHDQLFIKSKILRNMIKFGFGASAVVAATFFAVSSQIKADDTSNRMAPVKSAQVLPATKITETHVEVPVASFPGKDQLPLEKLRPADLVVNPVDPVDPVDPVGPAQPAAAVEPATAPEPEANSPLFKSGRAAPLYGLEPDNKGMKDSLYEAPGFTSIDTSLTGISRLEVKISFCNIDIKQHNGDNVKVSGRIRETGNSWVFGKTEYRKGELRMRIEKKDTVLSIYMEEVKLEKTKKVARDDKEKEPEESRLAITVPKGVNVIVSNSSGNIVAEGLTTKKVDLRTSFGNIMVKHIDAEISLKSGSGNVTASDLTGRVQSTTSFGHQSIVQVTGDLKCRSSSGNVTVKDLKGNGDINSSFGFQKIENMKGNLECKASSGDIVIRSVEGNIHTRSSFGKVHLEDVSGDISSKTSSGGVQIARVRGTLSIGTSFGNIVGSEITLTRNSEFKTSSGNIDLALKNDMKDLRFDLQSSSGDLQVIRGTNKSRSDNKLQVGEGPIIVKGISSFGNQNYR